MKHLFLILILAVLPLTGFAQSVNSSDPNLAPRLDGSGATDEGNMNPFNKNVANPYCCGNKIADGEYNADPLIEPTGDGDNKKVPVRGAGGTDKK